MGTAIIQCAVCTDHNNTQKSDFQTSSKFFALQQHQVQYTSIVFNVAFLFHSFLVPTVNNLITYKTPF